MTGRAKLGLVLPSLEERRLNRGAIGGERRPFADADIHLAEPAFEVGESGRKCRPLLKSAARRMRRSPPGAIEQRGATRASASARWARSAARRGRMVGSNPLIDPDMGVVGVFRR